MLGNGCRNVYESRCLRNDSCSGSTSCNSREAVSISSICDYNYSSVILMINNNGYSDLVSITCITTILE